MRQSILYAAALAAAPLAAAQAGTSSSKRGLVYVDTEDNASDDAIWAAAAGTELSWYYNYQVQPTASLKSTSLSFVPMLWGASDADDAAGSTAFRDAVRGLLRAGNNITHVLGFNEPDGTTATGGSNIPADLAASTWKREIEPLRDNGIKVGAPAVTSSPAGFDWLQAFFTACDGGCRPDFLPVHFYGSFEGFASHLGQVAATYPNMSDIWVTEFAYADVDLDEAHVFFNSSIEYMDTKLKDVSHYSYFGSFRSSVSNVGENAAMLNSKGKLTDIGSWYLGKGETGVEPDSAAGRTTVFAGWGVLVGLASVYALL